MEELERLSKEIGKHWISLGRRLEFTEAELIAFDKENDNYAEKPYKMLLHWKQRDGDKKATYRVLYEALCHDLVECRLLAQQFCCVNTNLSCTH